MTDLWASIESPWLQFALLLLGWLVVTALVYQGSRYLIHWLTYRSRTQLDDIIIRIVGPPLNILVFSFGILHAWETAFGASTMTDTLQRAHQGVLIFAGAYIVWRILYDVVVAYLKPLVEESESQADDVIIPILTRVGPVIIFVAALNALVATLGGDLAAWLAGIGLVGIVAGYLFQEPLQGLFSGTYLALDSPFRPDDLIILGDDTLCQVYNVGVRVTQLYDVKRRNLMYVPNSDLVTRQIINVTKPSVEQRMSLAVTLDRSLEPKTARNLLLEACYAHENILGPWQEKKVAIRERMAAYAAEYAALREGSRTAHVEQGKMLWLKQQATRLEGELIRLDVENTLRQKGEAFSEALLKVVQKVAQLEDLGFTADERETIRREIAALLDRLDLLVEQITVWLYLIKIIQYQMVDETYSQCVARFAERNVMGDDRLTFMELVECGAPQAPTRPMVVRADIDRIRASDLEADKAVDRGSFVTRSDYADYKRLYTIWHRSVTQAYRALVKAHEFRGLGAGEWHLDRHLREFEQQFSNNFLLRVGRWQLPTVNLVDASDAELKFQVEFSIDDVMRDQFQRAERVTAELLMEIDRMRASLQVTRTEDTAFTIPSTLQSPGLPLVEATGQPGD